MEYFHVASFVTPENNMKVSEVVTAPANKAKKKPAATQTDFERNAAALRSKERKLNARGPVSPIKHRP